MSVQLMGAMLTLRTEEDANGQLHLIEPLPAQTVPRPSSGDMQRIWLPPFRATLVLWGAEPGPFQLQTSWIHPPEDDRRRLVETLLRTTESWWPEELFSVNITDEYHIEVRHRVSGVYLLRFRFNGEQIAELPVPIYWEDELPSRVRLVVPPRRHA